MITFNNLTLYVSPPGMGDGSSGKAVVWGHDIFGWESGRTKELVDRLFVCSFLFVLLWRAAGPRSWSTGCLFVLFLFDFVVESDRIKELVDRWV